MRVTPQMARIKAYQRDEFVDHLSARARVANRMDHKRFFDNIVNSHPRVQRPERVLKNELHLPPKPLQIFAIESEHIDRSTVVVEGDGP